MLAARSPCTTLIVQRLKTPRVLHLLAPARHGGLESVVTMLAAVQGASEAQVAAVLVPDDVAEHPFLLRLQQLGIRVATVVVPARKYRQEYRALSTLVGEVMPRIIHTHGYHADVLGGAIARRLRIPVVSTVHGFVGGSLRNRAYERIQLISLRRADAVVAVSRPLVERLSRAGIAKQKIHFVANGYTQLVPAMTKEQARQRLDLPVDGKIAGWIGRLSPEKGPDVILAALAASKPVWHLSVIGDGKMRQELQQRANALGVADRIRWHGPLSDAGSLVPAFDALVLSSRTEGTPIVLFEAMHTSVPILATTVGGIPDVVSSLEAILVPPEQPAQIANALDALLTDSAAAKERAANAKEKLVRSFGAERWLAAIEDVYRAAEANSARKLGHVGRPPRAKPHTRR